MEKEFCLQDSILFAGAAQALQEFEFPQVNVFQKGEYIFTSDTYQNSLGIILDGKAQAVSSAQTKMVMKIFSVGDLFGSAALFGEENAYVSDIVAITECTVQFIPEELLTQIFTKYPQTALNYIRFLSSRIRLLNQKIAVLSQNSVEGRLYRYLCENRDSDGFLTKVKMTQLAASLRMGRTSLYRAVTQLEQKQWIKRHEDGSWEVIS